MATVLDESNVEKKFRGVSQTQESIQSLTLWVIHHKAQHEKIVDLWFQVLKKSKIPHRLTLFYLCNDIVQTCKKKHAIVYKDAFKEVLKDAVLLVRDNSIRNNVERIFTIWEERGVYDKGFLEELSAILSNTKLRAAANSKLLAEFKPNELVQLIQKVKKNDEEVTACNRQLLNLRVDTSDIEMIKQLKDRSQCKDYCQRFEDSHGKLQIFVDSLEKDIKDKGALVEMLEQSELFYETQYGEAKIVANAYKNFGTRVNNLRRRLEDHMKTLPDPYSPVPSPSVDAPSPGNTPPQVHADILESMDMDLSDEDGGESESKEIKQTPGLHSPTNPTAGSVPSHPLLPAGLSTNFLSQLEEGKTSVGSSWANTSSDLATSQSSSTNLVQLTEGNGTPVNDEGNSTPVQDEQPESAQSRNPIEFLTQLISQSQKNPASASFFQNLTSLTEKVKQSKIKNSEQTVAGDRISQSASSGEDFPCASTSPAPPTWESWSVERETPSYVPDTRPTPGLPFAEIPAPPQNEPFTVESQAQSMPYGTDTQSNSLYGSVQHTNSQSYSTDSLTPAQQPYDIESKPGDEQFSSQSSQSAVFGSDPQNTASHSGDPTPPPLSRSYSSDTTFVSPDHEQQSPVGMSSMFVSSTVPPAPPVTVSGNGNNGLPSVPTQSQYTPQFYQEVPVSPSAGSGQMQQNSNPGAPPGTPTVNISEASPLNFPPLPPVSSWSQPMFSTAPPFSTVSTLYLPPQPPTSNATASMPECGTPPYLESGCTSSINSSGPQGTSASYNASGSAVQDGTDFSSQVSQQPQVEGSQSHSAVRRNLAPVPMAGFESPASTSNSDQDTEVLTIPTMVGKGRPSRPLHGPRPPPHPPRTVGGLRAGQFGGGSSGGEADQQEFIDKLKYKSKSPSVPAGPTKSILKASVQGIRNLRTLTDHMPQQYDDGTELADLQDSTMGNAVGASDMEVDTENARNETHGQIKPESCVPPRWWPGETMLPPGQRPPLFGRGGPPFRGPRPDEPWQPFRQDPRFVPNRIPPPFGMFRDNHGRPFPKRPPPPFEFRQRFPRY